jgi:hypothetical protein
MINRQHASLSKCPDVDHIDVGRRLLKKDGGNAEQIRRKMCGDGEAREKMQEVVTCASDGKEDIDEDDVSRYLLHVISYLTEP